MMKPKARQIEKQAKRDKYSNHESRNWSTMGREGGLTDIRGLDIWGQTLGIQPQTSKYGRSGFLDVRGLDVQGWTPNVQIKLFGRLGFLVVGGLDVRGPAPNPEPPTSGNPERPKRGP